MPCCADPFCYLVAPHAVFTGAFWVILRLCFTLMWLSILLSPMIM